MKYWLNIQEEENSATGFADLGLFSAISKIFKALKSGYRIEGGSTKWPAGGGVKLI